MYSGAQASHNKNNEIITIISLIFYFKSIYPSIYLSPVYYLSINVSIHPTVIVWPYVLRSYLFMNVSNLKHKYSNNFGARSHSKHLEKISHLSV